MRLDTDKERVMKYITHDFAKRRNDLNSMREEIRRLLCSYLRHLLACGHPPPIPCPPKKGYQLKCRSKRSDLGCKQETLVIRVLLSSSFAVFLSLSVLLLTHFYPPSTADRGGRDIGYWFGREVEVVAARHETAPQKVHFITAS